MNKSIFKSKTAAAAFITTGLGALAGFVPSIGQLIAENVAGILVGVGVINFVLRMVTKGSVSLFPEE